MNRPNWTFHPSVPGCAFWLLILFGSSAQAINTPSSLIVFGDSLSDTGNRFVQSGGAFPVAPYVDGRFTNGPTYIDVLANLFGVSSLNSLSGGTNYAYGGAEINSFNGLPAPAPGSVAVPPLTGQADTYLTANGGVADPDALYVVLGGGNDLRSLAAGQPVDLADSAAAVAGIVSELSAAGAINILVPNVPNLGLTPEAQAGGPAGVALATAGTNALNQAVEAALGTLAIEANVALIDTFGITNEIVANPELFGLTNVTDACYLGVTGEGGPGSVCANPEQYLFWDLFHPSAAVHDLLGNRIYAQVVPLPAALPLLISALSLLGLVAGKRRNQKL